MKKVISFFLLIASSAFAQWQMPARQITNSTSSFGFIPTTNYTVQRVFDWSDDEFARINTVNTNQDAQITAIQATNSAQQSSITNLQARVSTNEVAISNLQASVTSLGTNLTATQNSYLKGTNIAGASYSTSSLTWTVPDSAVTLATNIFGSSYSNVNEGFTYVKNEIGELGSNTFVNGSIFAGYMFVSNKFVLSDSATLPITNYNNSGDVNSDIVTANLSNGTFSINKTGLYFFEVTASIRIDGGSSAGHIRLGFEGETNSVNTFSKIAIHRISQTTGDYPSPTYVNHSGFQEINDTNTKVNAFIRSGVNNTLTNDGTYFFVYYMGENN